MGKFSICIPNYNYSKYIGNCIESVLAQTYDDFEIVIVDNASTDESWNVICKYSMIDPRIKAFKNNYNIGFSHNLDRVVSKASNDFIVVLSSDDSMNLNALAEYSILLDKLTLVNHNLLICSSVNVIDANGHFIDYYGKNRFHSISDRAKYRHCHNNSSVSDYDGLELFNHLFLKFSVPGAFCSTLFSKSLYSKVGGYSSLNLIGPDAHFAYKCLLSGSDVVYIDRPLFNYRLHSSGQLNNSSKNKNLNVLIDRYLFSQQYNDDQLARAKSSRLDFCKSTVNTDCLNMSFLLISKGNNLLAFQHLSFAFAAYPLVAMKNIKTYILIFLLLLGPIGSFFCKIFFRIRLRYL